MIPWDHVFELLETPEYRGCRDLLGLPKDTNCVPALQSHKTLTDRNFSVMVTGWHDATGEKLSDLHVCGGVSRLGRSLVCSHARCGRHFRRLHDFNDDQTSSAIQSPIAATGDRSDDRRSTQARDLMDFCSGISSSRPKNSISGCAPIKRVEPVSLRSFQASKARQKTGSMNSTSDRQFQNSITSRRRTALFRF